MRKFATLLVLGLFSLPASAQGNYTRVELFGGFSLGSVKPARLLNLTPDQERALGFQAAVTGNLTRNIGIVIELGGLWGDLPTSSSPFGTTTGTFRTFHLLVGPRFAKRSSRATGYVHFLAGLAQQKSNEIQGPSFRPLPVPSVPIETSSTSNGFGAALGGGLDISVNKRISIRAVQVDYLPMRVEGDWTNSVRVGVGVVLKFGGSP